MRGTLVYVVMVKVVQVGERVGRGALSSVMSDSFCRWGVAECSDRGRLKARLDEKSDL